MPAETLEMTEQQIVRRSPVAPVNIDVAVQGVTLTQNCPGTGGTTAGWS